MNQTQTKLLVLKVSQADCGHQTLCKTRHGANTAVCGTEMFGDVVPGGLDLFFYPPLTQNDGKESLVSNTTLHLYGKCLCGNTTINSFPLFPIVPDDSLFLGDAFCEAHRAC